mgnify:CR=1 FL=1
MAAGASKGFERLSNESAHRGTHRVPHLLYRALLVAPAVQHDARRHALERRGAREEVERV